MPLRRWLYTNVLQLESFVKPASLLPWRIRRMNCMDEATLGRLPAETDDMMVLQEADYNEVYLKSRATLRTS